MAQSALTGSSKPRGLEKLLRLISSDFLLLSQTWVSSPNYPLPRPYFCKKICIQVNPFSSSPPQQPSPPPPKAYHLKNFFKTYNPADLKL